MKSVSLYLSFGGRNPLSRAALPLLLGALDLLPRFLVDPDNVVVGKDLAVDHGLFGERLPLLELGPPPALLLRPLLLSRLVVAKSEETVFVLHILALQSEQNSRCWHSEGTAFVLHLGTTEHIHTHNLACREGTRLTLFFGRHRAVYKIAAIQ